MKFNPHTDKHIVVKYHYVENPRHDRAGIHPCPVNEFERQIVFLKKNFKITSVPEVFRAARAKSSEKMCSLTFDDGLKDNYLNVAPLLKKHGLTATFFPITKTWEGFLPATHRIHLLLSLESAGNLTDLFNSFLRSSFPKLSDSFFVPKNKRMTQRRKIYDDVITANFKETMNLVPRTVRDSFLGALLFDMKVDEKGWARELFMSPREIKGLRDYGHSIGSHGHYHDAFDMLDEQSILADIRVSKKLLEETTQVPVDIFAYPQSSPRDEIGHLLAEEQIAYALTTEKQQVAGNVNHFHIPRYDTNDIRDFLNNPKTR